MFKDKKWYLKEDGAVPDEKYLKKLDAYAAYAGAVKDRENAYKDLYDREEFSYDVNKDAMYDKLVQDYAENASKAAEDAMGRAVSLTGGYGNSYAQQVSQQTFQDYMGGLDAEADKLYDRALDRYLLQGEALADKYALASDMADQKYAEYEAILGSKYAQEQEAEPEDKAAPADLSEYEYKVEGMNTAEDALTYIQSMADLGNISEEEAKYLVDNYARKLPQKADYEKRAENRDDSAYVADEKLGGGNLWGIDRNAKVTYTFADGNTDTLTLGQLFRRLVSEGMDRKEARKKVIKIQHDLGISKKGNE